MKTKNAHVVLITALAGSAALLAQQATPTFRTGANVVVVPVVVKDGGGRFVFGLTPQDFEVSDGGVRRDVVQFGTEQVPVSLGILLDISGSMSQDVRVADDPRWSDTRRAFELLLTRLTPTDEVFFAAFRDTLLLAAPWTRDHPRVLRAFNGMTPGGQTFLFKALSAISPMFQVAQHRRKVLLLISDGRDSTVSDELIPPKARPSRSGVIKGERSGQIMGEYVDGLGNQLSRLPQGLLTARDAINQSDVLLYAVGIGTREQASVDVATLTSLTTGTGGYVETLRDPSDIAAAIARICDDLQAQYVLGFEPGRADGKLHKISVKVRKRGLRVHARTGYVAEAAR